MIRPSERVSQADQTATAACGVLEAESDYYDCMARFGHDSAEAHVAERLWRQLRREKAQSAERRI